MWSVAVIDTGVAPGPKLLPGVNLSGDGAPDDTIDPNGHGTAVAEAILRAAPEARLVPVRVLNSRGALAEEGLLPAAFRWIRQHSGELGVTVVCAAFADASHQTSDLKFRGAPLQAEIAALRENGIPTVAAAGNWFPERRRRGALGMAWPAILREVVSVGELERRPDGLWLTRTTQRLHASLETGCSTTVFAVPEGLGETSGAAATVAGYLAGLRQELPGAGVDQLVRHLLRDGATARDESGLLWPGLPTRSAPRPAPG